MISDTITRMYTKYYTRSITIQYSQNKVHTNGFSKVEYKIALKVHGHNFVVQGLTLHSLDYSNLCNIRT